MNTPKKFRVWLPSLNKFDDTNGAFIDCYGKLYCITTSGRIVQSKEFDEYIIQWYTGLTDKNSKEIYEGDILDFTARYKQTGPVPVIYYGASFGCVVTDDGGLKEFWNLSHIVQQHYPEIIGNISENPELLK
jgi:uncharacterized phage protein (TIGR01671 family)